MITGAKPGIVALSEDPALLEALSQAATGRATIIACPSADRFVDQVVANAAELALIDAAAAPAPLEQFVATVREQFPQLLVVLSGTGTQQQQFSSQLAAGTIFRFVHKPASAQRLKLFVDATLRAHQGLELLSSTTEMRALDLNSAQDRTEQFSSIEPPRRSPLWVLIAVAATLIGIVVIATVRQPSEQSSPPARPVANIPAQQEAARTARAAVAEAERADAERSRLLAESQAREAALLEQVQRTASGARADQAHVYVELARKRLASGALLQPADDSAHAYVEAALALAADDADVRAVAIALGDALMGAFRRAIAAGDANQAATWLQACSDYHISNATVSQLASQLEALRASQGEHSEQAVQLQRDFNQRLEQGQLLAPANDSAIALYQRLKALDPNNGALPTMLRALRSTVAADVQTRISREAFGEADQELRAAHAAGLDGDELGGAAAALERAHRPEASGAPAGVGTP